VPHLAVRVVCSVAGLNDSGHSTDVGSLFQANLGLHKALTRAKPLRAGTPRPQPSKRAHSLCSPRSSDRQARPELLAPALCGRTVHGSLRARRLASVASHELPRIPHHPPCPVHRFDSAHRV
jgi:hypothetical protein